MLQELRNQIARCEAENTLLRLQAKPTPPADLISRGVIDRELRRLGNVVLGHRYEAPQLAARVTAAVLALRQLVQGVQI